MVMGMLIRGHGASLFSIVQEVEVGVSHCAIRLFQHAKTRSSNPKRYCIGTPNRARLVGYLGSKDATLKEVLA